MSDKKKPLSGRELRRIRERAEKLDRVAAAESAADGERATARKMAAKLRKEHPEAFLVGRRLDADRSRTEPSRGRDPFSKSDRIYRTRTQRRAEDHNVGVHTAGSGVEDGASFGYGGSFGYSGGVFNDPSGGWGGGFGGGAGGAF